jgi:predicted nucleotidyltransferase
VLGILGRSIIRKKIILLFVYNQRKEFYLSEIARQVKTSAGTTQRELNKLLAQDFITFKKRGNLNIYKLNESYPLLREIEAIVQKTFGIEAELRNELGKLRGVKFAFLFGSFVEGSFKSDSDIDLFIIGAVDEDDVYKTIQKVEDSVGRQINYHLADEPEFIEKSKSRAFYREILAGPLMLVGDENALREIVR